MANGFTSMLGNPAFQMGMGILGGNIGKSRQSAFANAMRSGLQANFQGQQMAMLAQMQELQRQRLEQEIQREKRAEERRRQTGEILSSAAFQSASPEQRRGLLAARYPEAAAKGMLSDSPEYLEYLTSKAQEARAPDLPPAPKTHVNFINPTTGEGRAVRPESQEADQLAAAGWTRVGVELTGTPQEVFPGTRSQKGEDVRESQFIMDVYNELGNFINQVEQDPTLVGAVGGMRSGVQGVLGVAKDVSALSPRLSSAITQLTDKVLSTDAVNAMPEKERMALFSNPRLSQKEMLENRFGLALARIQYPTGRIPVEVIRRSIKDVKMTGLTSSTGILNRLREVHGRFGDYVGNIQQRLGSPSTIAPQPGSVEGGYRFLGGDPADPNNWVPR